MRPEEICTPRLGLTRLLLGPLLLAGCSLSPVATRPALEARRPTVEVGTASWYGPGFHGNRTSSGEIYDQNELTAAHPTLPLGSHIMVTNLANGRSAELCVNDRGPFARGRIIDLSYGAARALRLVGSGTARVRVEPLPQAGGSRPACHGRRRSSNP